MDGAGNCPGAVKRWWIVLAAAAAGALLAASALWGQRRPCTKQLFAMDTYMTFTAYGHHGEAAVDAAMEEVRRLDALLSAEDPDSEISRLNTAGQSVVSPDTESLLRTAQAVCRDTGGLFDCTVYPLMELWGFPSGDFRVPTEAEIGSVLPLVDGSAIRLEDGRAVLGPGQSVDLGGIAKGYAAARAMEIFRAHGVESGLVSLGGNVQVLGSRPDGSDFRIGVRDPSGGAGSYLAVLALRDRAAVTSGGYERYFERDGRTYIHILDPRTGHPAETGLLSATAVSSDGTLADALSTALFIMGPEAAADYWRESGGAFDMILVTEDREILATEGLDLETDLPVTVLRRT